MPDRDRLRPLGERGKRERAKVSKLDEAKLAEEKAACWRLATCRLKGLRARAGRIFPGMPAIFVGGHVHSTLDDSE